MKHSLFACLLFAMSVAAQTRDVVVSAPTRLDWQFAVHGFGAGAAKLPAGYDSTKQRYQLHMPKVDKKPKAWPLVLFISPNDKPSGLAAWKAVCDREGVLFASPYAAGNPVPAGQRTRIVLDVLDDIRRTFPVDPDQTYVAGFSGGGRMACAIGFALPECFGGIAPVCGTNPLTKITYLRHRAADRLSLAFITGETDMNRKENEAFMHPWMEEVGIRSKLWVVPGLGHAIPDAKVTAEVYAFLKEDLKRRRADREAFPGLSLPTADELASDKLSLRFADEGIRLVNDPKHAWRGVALLQGVTQRWPKTPAAAKAASRLGEVLKDEKLLERIGEQGDKDEQLSLSAQARAFERFGRIPQAIQAWEILVMSQPGSPAALMAEKEIRRLRK